jgi:hypothetical protein
MKTPKPDIVFIAGTTDAWRRPVERLIDNRLEMMTLDPTESIPDRLKCVFSADNGGIPSGCEGLCPALS